MESVCVISNTQSCEILEENVFHIEIWFYKKTMFFFAAQPSNQSPMSLTSDASSPRSYVSPRISTPQTNTVPLKPLMTTPPVSSQQKVSSC